MGVMLENPRSPTISWTSSAIWRAACARHGDRHHPGRRADGRHHRHRLPPPSSPRPYNAAGADGGAIDRPPPAALSVRRHLGQIIPPSTIRFCLPTSSANRLRHVVRPGCAHSGPGAVCHLSAPTCSARASSGSATAPQSTWRNARPCRASSFSRRAAHWAAATAWCRPSWGRSSAASPRRPSRHPWGAGDQFRSWTRGPASVSRSARDGAGDDPDPAGMMFIPANAQRAF